MNRVFQYRISVFVVLSLAHLHVARRAASCGGIRFRDRIVCRSASADLEAKASAAVQSALDLHAQAQYEQAIVQWLAAADGLVAITSVDTKEARKAIALALEATTDALCLQRCGSASCQ